MPSGDPEIVITDLRMPVMDGLAMAKEIKATDGAVPIIITTGQGEKMLTDINKALEGTITISRNEWKYVADMETDFELNLPLVNCVVDEINQVTLNLIINAVDAIKEVVKDGTFPKKKILIKTRRKENWVQISISDTEAGIPASIMDKIFDPFFTTKEVGKGTGQGLSIVHDIVVNKHQGKITVDSEPGKGATFVISL